MEGWALLTEILIVLGAAFLFGAAFERIGLSAMIGYLFAGVVLGPHATGLVADVKAVEVLAELGVGLLLFSIGLEFSWSRLRASGRTPLLGGVLQVVVTFAVISLIAWSAGAPVRLALVAGAVFCLSSTATVLRGLARDGALDTVYGRHALGILLVQDVSVIPLVLLVDTLGLEGSPGIVLLHLGRTIAYALALGLVFWVIALKLLPRIFGLRTLWTNRELGLLLAAVAGFGATAAAHAVGLSPAVGAFLAGMLLAESVFASQIRADLGGIRTLLVTIFFVSVGMLADPAWVAAHPLPVAGYVVALMVGKALIVWVVLVLLGLDRRNALATGIGLAQTGEFAFVLAGQAHPSVLGSDALVLVASVSVLTLMLTPPLVRYAPRLADLLLRRPHPTGKPRAETGHVIVVGLGPAGLEVVRVARERGCEVLVVELAPSAIERARALGASTHLGDATNPEVLEHAGLAHARALVLTVPDVAGALVMVSLSRSLAPNTPVLVRARYSRFRVELEEAGAEVVVDEEVEVGRALAGLLQL